MLITRTGPLAGELLPRSVHAFSRSSQIAQGCFHQHPACAFPAPSLPQRREGACALKHCIWCAPPTSASPVMGGCSESYVYGPIDCNTHAHYGSTLLPLRCCPPQHECSPASQAWGEGRKGGLEWSQSVSARMSTCPSMCYQTGLLPLCSPIVCPVSILPLPSRAAACVPSVHVQQKPTHGAGNACIAYCPALFA